MRIVIPYAGRRHPAVEAAAPAAVDWVDVGGDPHDYWRVMNDVWAECADSGRDLLVIEHDVVFRPDVMVAFRDCEEPWCVFHYANICHFECREAWANMLGCTRFRSQLIRSCPDAVSTIPPELRDWHNLCDHIAGNKINGVPAPQRPEGVRARFTHHWHEPPVDHIDRNVDPAFWYGPGGRYAPKAS